MFCRNGPFTVPICAAGESEEFPRLFSHIKPRTSRAHVPCLGRHAQPHPPRTIDELRHKGRQRPLRQSLRLFS
jgi:hypothetical protein